MSGRDENFPGNGFEVWGGYMNAKIAKLEEQFSTGIGNEDKLSDIFNGVSIYVNGFTVPSADELKELMGKHGGVYHTYQRRDDFIIASNLPDTKVKKMSLIKIVKPEWITDSIKANRLLNYKEYLLYRNSRTQSILPFNNTVKTENVLGQTAKQACQNIHKIEDNINSKNLTSVKSFINPVQCSNLQTSDCKNVAIYAKTAADPSFITEFYNNSRLHHISQLGACFKQHVNDIRENSTFMFPERDVIKSKICAFNSATTNLSQTFFQNGKTIMHIDMDCFFVSVGLRNRPELRGKPVAVTHSKGGKTGPKRSGTDILTESNLYKQKQTKKHCLTMGIPTSLIEVESVESGGEEEVAAFGSMSEIASCSYEARAKGIRNGMFMGKALKLCPDLKTIPYDFDGYKEVAYTLYNTISQYTLDIEAVSCDEMYVDCTELLKTMNVNVSDFATVLREEIKSKTECPCSTGFGGNRLQARLATKKAKPNGQFFLSSDIVYDFMFNIPLSELPGVGYQISQKLECLGHQTCGSLQSLSLTSLQQHLGKKTGAQLYDQCRGQDSIPLSFHTVRKSVSAEVNYGIRFENIDQCKEFLKQLSAEVHSRMQQLKVFGKCITLKLMVRAQNAPVQTAKFMGHGYCDVINKSTTLQSATNDVEVITKEVISICKKQNVDPKEMRGIGIQITKLEPINIKPLKGAINKFLTAKSVVKQENLAQSFTKESVYITKENTCQVDVKVKVPSTPKKNTITTPRKKEKKSPILAMSKSKSPKGKRRGRPPKQSKPLASLQSLSKFLQGSSNICNEKNCYKDVDIKTDESKNRIPLIKSKTEDTKPEGLLRLQWRQVRELLRAWFDSGQVPKFCDVNLIAGYMREMVIKKNLEKLHILLNFMNRKIREINNNIWNEVQDYVIEQVQNAMIAVYGKKLLISKV